MRRICSLSIGLALAAVLAGSAGAARSLRPPRVGDWEGKGTRGLQLSFQLGRVGSRIRAEALAITVPAGCPATLRDTVTFAGTHPVYAGPRAAPPGLSHPLFTKPGTIGFSLTALHFPIGLEGPLVTARLARLTMRAPGGQSAACWPRTLRFTAKPTTRVAVADGKWNGTLAEANGSTGTVRLTVEGRGRAIDSFSFDFSCSTSEGGGSFSFGPDTNGQFIAADGTFSGPAAHFAEPALRITWQGQFSADGAVSGTIANLGDPCGAGESNTATFTAHHA